MLDKPSLFPHSFILSIMVILNKGSIESHSSTENINQNQDIAKVCFETLLQYSLLDQSEPLANGNGGYDTPARILTNGVVETNGKM